MKNIALVLSLFPLAFFFSCSSEEVKSSDNYIEKFELDDIIPIEINILNDQLLISIWTDPSNYEKLKTKEPKIEVSSGASYSKSKDDWTAKDFQYIVKAENGDIRSYKVEISTDIPRKYSFDTWTQANGYYAPSGLNSRWTSGNAGISMALSMLDNRDNKNPKSYPTRDTTDKYGNAVLLETIEGGEIKLVKKNVPLFSGNFIYGNFNLAKILDELLATEVGRTYNAKPKSIKGYYKYKEGREPFMYNGTPEPGKHDSCSMNAVFYQSDLPGGKDTVLTAKDIDPRKSESELVIARASLKDCSQTEGEEFHEFTATFNYYENKPAVDFNNHSYKLGITFAASKYGDDYAGKIGSKLIIDEIEIIDF